jgi:disulfide bond formation protein DsbB
MKAFLKKYILHLVFLVALISTLTSLYFSDILKLVPCILCWYQRIAMYPLVILLAVSIIRKDKDVVWYILPLSLIGWIIAIYHNLLYYKILPESIAPCQAGISCTTQQLLLFGWFTIPLGAFIAFTVINLGMLLYILLHKTKTKQTG